MRCDICDKEDALIAFDKQTGKFGSCGTCQEIIDETVRELEEASTEEDG